MAESLNAMDIGPEKPALEDSKVSDDIKHRLTKEYREFLRIFNTTIKEIDLIYSRMDAASTHFQECIIRLQNLSEKASPHSSVALENMRVRTLSFYTNQLRPFLSYFCEARVPLRKKAVDLRIYQNLNELKEEIRISREMALDAEEKAVIWESALSHLDEFVKLMV